MSSLCGGSASVLNDLFWWIIYVCKKNKEICPRCGHTAFKHGFVPREEEYCTHCHLWEPDWEERDRIFKEMMKEQGEEHK